MADGLGYSEGSGAEIATDDAGASGHVQIIKLAISADGSATVIPADATNGLDVDVTRVIPGTDATHLGKAEDAAHSSGDTGIAILAVRTDTAAASSGTDGDYEVLHTDSTGRLRTTSTLQDGSDTDVTFAEPAQISVTPTLDTSAYASGDSMDTTALSFTSAVKSSGGNGWITAVRFIDKDDQGQDMELAFFDSSVTPATENAAHALSDGDAAKFIDSVKTSDGSWLDNGNNQVCTIRPSPWIPYHCTGSTTLYGVLISRGTGTYTASGVVIELDVMKVN